MDQTMTRSRSKPGEDDSPTEDLFRKVEEVNTVLKEDDDEPAPNSPEDLGLVTPTARPYGVETPEPEKPTTNASTNALQIPEIHKFINWVHAQDLPVHADVKVGHCAVAFSGLCVADLRWLCQAIRQAGRAPVPATMKKAILARDVSILRPGHDIETTQKWPITRD